MVQILKSTATVSGAEIMEIAVDSSSDLPTATGLTGHTIAMGSIAWDISTGDFYGMGSDGQWVNQNDDQS